MREEISTLTILGWTITCLGGLLFAGSMKKSAELSSRLSASEGEKTDSSIKTILLFAILGGLSFGTSFATDNSEKYKDMSISGRFFSGCIFGGISSGACAAVSVGVAAATRPNMKL